MTNSNLLNATILMQENPLSLAIDFDVPDFEFSDLSAFFQGVGDAFTNIFNNVSFETNSYVVANRSPQITRLPNQAEIVERTYPRSPVPDSVYSVQQGDNLWNIAKDHYDLSDPAEIQEAVEHIMEHNDITNANKINIGQPVNLPADISGGAADLDWAELDRETQANKALMEMGRQPQLNSRIETAVNPGTQDLIKYTSEDYTLHAPKDPNSMGTNLDLVNSAERELGTAFGRVASQLEAAALESIRRGSPAMNGRQIENLGKDIIKDGVGAVIEDAIDGITGDSPLGNAIGQRIEREISGVLGPLIRNM